MELTHSFTVPASVAETWDAFQDIEAVAGCFPGATVTSVEGDEFSGSCKVKLGPIALTYSGKGEFVEKDEGAHRFVVEAKGKDKRGNGTAGATVTATLADADGSGTRVEVLTDLSITGKPAQFGRGVIQDVSDKLLQQFVGCLETKVGGAAEPAAPEPEPEPPLAQEAAASTAAMAASGDEAGGGAAETPARDATSAPRAASLGERPQAPDEDNALDLGSALLPILLKSYWKPLVGALVALLVLRGLRRRRRRRRS